MKSNFLLFLAIIFVSCETLNTDALFSKRIVFRHLAGEEPELTKQVKSLPDRSLQTVLNTVLTSKEAVNEIRTDEFSMNGDLINSSPEAERMDTRTQLMSYNLQFTDDIRLIIDNVLKMRRDFEKTKKMYALMGDKSLFRGANYKVYNDDIRLGRPLQMMLTNGEIQPPPRVLSELPFMRLPTFEANGNFENQSDDSHLSDEENHESLKLAKEYMTPDELTNSGIETVVKTVDYKSMYKLNDNDINSFYVEQSKNAQKLIL